MAHDEQKLQQQVDKKVDFETFFAQAPRNQGCRCCPSFQLYREMIAFALNSARFASCRRPTLRKTPE
jgi:hypothetical protein